MKVTTDLVCKELQKIFTEYLDNMRPYIRNLTRKKIIENRARVLLIRKEYKTRIADLLTNYGCGYEKTELLDYISYNGKETGYRIARFKIYNSNDSKEEEIDLTAIVEWDWAGNYKLLSMSIKKD
ncbi:MAG: hypothetical protein QXI92_00120 [Candidatus Nitrosocaldus sp.]